MSHIVWEGSPAIFTIGSFELRWYSLMFALSFYLGHRIMKKVYIKEGRGEALLDPLLYHLVIGTIVGARLGHCLFYEPEYYLSNLLEILLVWKGGLASHGGAVGVFIAVVLYCRKYKESYIWLLDQLSIPIVLAASFIRLGNFFNSEILGYQTNVPWAIIFQRVDSIPRHPAQLYEALAYLSIFLILKHFAMKVEDKMAPGRMFGFLLSSVFTVRVLIEFVKIRQEAYDTTFMLNTGQLLSIPLIFVGLYLCLFFKVKEPE